MTAIQLKEIIKKLRIHEVSYNIVDVYDNSYIEVIQQIEGKEVIFIIGFSKGFPYQFPEITVKNIEFKNMPHIDKKTGKLCLFKQEAKPNPTKPIEVIEESIVKAQKIIFDGLKGLNKEDFIDEFDSYWSEDAIGVMDVIFEPSNNVEKLKCIYSKDFSFWCCGTNYDELLRYAQRNYKKDELIIEDAIYIPLSKKIYPPFPNTNKDFYKIILNEKNYEQYRTFLTNRKGNSVILFSQQDKGKYILSSIIHTGIGDLQGFRKGKISPEVAYLMTYSNKKILKLRTEIINRKRLFYRGGDGNLLTKKISILGCGSLGGYLINSLTEMGAHDFKLIDKDILSKENIARHICGIDCVDMYKVEAIKRKLENHYIDLKIKTYTNDLYKIISENLEELEDRDIHFIAVGDKALESYFIKKYNDGEIKGSMIIVWVEPYAIGGHAIILNKKQNNVEECIYDKQWELKSRILENPGEFTDKEAGCQSYFIPYSGFEADFFVRTLLDNVFNNKLLSDKNYLVTIAGKVDWARERQIKIMSKWIAAKNRTIKIEEI